MRLEDRCYATRPQPREFFGTRGASFELLIYLGNRGAGLRCLGSAALNGLRLCLVERYYSRSLWRGFREEDVLVRFPLRVEFGREHLNCDAMIFRLSVDTWSLMCTRNE